MNTRPALRSMVILIIVIAVFNKSKGSICCACLPSACFHTVLWKAVHLIKESARRWVSSADFFAFYLHKCTVWYMTHDARAFSTDKGETSFYFPFKVN